MILRIISDAREIERIDGIPTTYLPTLRREATTLLPDAPKRLVLFLEEEETNIVHLVGGRR